jgi:hypothetical protein
MESTEIVPDDLKEKIEALKGFDGELILFSVPWDFGNEGVLDFVIEASRHKKQAKLVLFDYLDGNESRFWSVMPHIDLYLKQYLHCNMDKYQKRFLGASEFIQYQVESGWREYTLKFESSCRLFGFLIFAICTHPDLFVQYATQVAVVICPAHLSIAIKP